MLKNINVHFTYKLLNTNVTPVVGGTFIAISACITFVESLTTGAILETPLYKNVSVNALKCLLQLYKIMSILKAVRLGNVE